MKRILFIIAASLLFSCNSGNNGNNGENDSIDTTEQQWQNLKITKKSGELYYRFVLDEPLFSEDDTVVYGGRTYSISWPEGDCEELHQALLSISFGNDSDFNSGAKRFLNGASSNYIETWYHYKVIKKSEVPISEYGNEPFLNDYEDIKIKCTTDDNLYCFEAFNSEYSYGAAHGTYASVFVTYDVAEKRVISLTDLIDTVGIGKTIKLALTTLDENSNAKCSVFSEVLSNKTIEPTMNYYISDDRSGIVLRYQIYEIAPYCEGYIDIVLPVSWLTKRQNFTDYGKSLLVKVPTNC